MRRAWPVMVLAALGTGQPLDERLARHRNLGKAFFENPTTHAQAVAEFRAALQLAPDSARERLNLGLALLANGQTPEGIAELERVQKQDPALPHSWFNLGVQYKKAGDYARAERQFEGFVKLVQDEPISRYNLGTLHKLAGRTEQAARAFEAASRLDPNLAAPHFQLYNLYRQQGKREEAAQRLKLFQQAKDNQANAAVPEDVDWSFYSEIHDPPGDRRVSSDQGPAPEPKFLARRLAPGSSGAGGIAVLDAEADGRPDLLTWAGGQLKLSSGGGVPVTLASGVIAAAVGDHNNDGFADVAIVTAQGPALLVNTKGMFTRRALNAPAGTYSIVVWIDYDHDYDLDLVLLGGSSALLRNQGQAGFQDQTASFPFAKATALSAAAFRLVPDTKGWDLVVTYREREAVLYRDKLAGKYESQPLAALAAGSQVLQAADADNNGGIDLLADSALLLNQNGVLARIDRPAPGPALLVDVENRSLPDLVAGGSVHRNAGAGRFSGTKALEGLKGAHALAAADFNMDGKPDLAMVGADGSVHLFTNQTAVSNTWMRIALAGVKNLKLAPGSEIEIKAGVWYQKKIYDGFPILFGMRGYKQADAVRITWPNGLIQNEPRQATGRVATYKEAQRLSGSCPQVWTWNGAEFVYITDVLGVAPLGASAGDGTYFPVDSLEHILLPAHSFKPRDGYYEVRLTEELSEVAYLDQIRLIAVDHALGTSVVLNEKFQAPPYPDLKVYQVAGRRYPVAARDHQGRDVRDLLLVADRRYPDQFKRTEAGAAEMHWIEMDFGRAAAPATDAILVLEGWVDWADGSTFLNHAQQSKRGLVTPYLQVKDERGEWRTVLEDMGMPAGKPKSIAVDLSGKFLPGDRSIRIVTNLAVYWDEAFLAERATAIPPVRGLTPASAELRFRGFSRAEIHPEREQPERFFYTDPLPVSMWNPTPGLYTRYGDVRPLTDDVDDRFVIMGSGDELSLRFNAVDLPPPALGKIRSFVLAVDGWAKDRDANTAHSQTVEPLPFHGMSGYPYRADEKFPDSQAHRAWRREYNLRPALRLLRPMTE